MNSGYMSHAAIFGIGGNITQSEPQKWSASPHFDVDAMEMEDVINVFNEPDLYIGKYLRLGQKDYIVTKCDMEMMLGRCHGGGFVLYRCQSLIIIGVFSDINYAASAKTLIVNMADYLQQYKF